MIARIVAAVVVVVAFVAYVWASDRITFQGERTIYTVNCAGGSWQAKLCTGRLVPAERYTFRVSRSRQEVLYWIVGSRAPSGKYTDCHVESRSNWSCNVRAGEPLTITYEMKSDKPLHGAEGLAIRFHAVPKWKWWALRYGVDWFHEAGL
jgi:hypothetical protein